MAKVSKIKLPNNSVLDIVDSSAYHKPSGGIPASDLASGVIPNVDNFYFVQGTSSAAGNSTSGQYLATKWEGSISGVTAATDGLKIAYRINTNPSVSGGGVVLSIDGTNYYPVVLNANTKVTTHYPVGSTILLVFNSTQTVSSVYLTSNTTSTVTGCWQIADYYSTDKIGYQLRTNSTVLPSSDACRYYKLFFTSADGTQWVPASTDKTNDTTTARTVNQRPIDPFGNIIYYAYTTNFSAGTNLSAAYCWQQYNLSLGYSFNRSGGELNLTPKMPVYIKCTPQNNGSAIIDSTTPCVQALPNYNDGKIYIFLGVATSATDVELQMNHPVYYHDGLGIRLWNGEKIQKTNVQNGHYIILDVGGLSRENARVILLKCAIDNCCTSILLSYCLDDVELSYALSAISLGYPWLNYTIEDVVSVYVNNNTYYLVLQATDGIECTATTLSGKPVTISSSDSLPGTLYCSTQILTPNHGVTSTNVATDKASNSKLASAKAVYDEVHPAKGSSLPFGGFLPNVLYTLGTISSNTTFTLASPSDSNVTNHYYFTFDIGSTVPTITWPSGTIWASGSAPALAANTHYEISILNSVAAVLEV